MDFTEIYMQTSGLVAPSPTTHTAGESWVLTAVEDRLIVRQTDTFQITRSWLVDNSHSSTSQLLSTQSKSRAGTSASDGWITHIGWSCDALYMFACCARRGIVNVFSLKDEQWNARIESGVEGLVKAEWAPDGRSILCFSEWGLRVTIWSLVHGSATYIQFPKYPGRGYAFHQDGRHFVLAERHKSRDTIGVYDPNASYKLLRHFPLPTSSLSSFALSPNGDHIAIWEGPLEYKLYIFNLSGQHLGTFVPDPDPGLGIRNFAWHPSGSMLAVSGWDDKIYILNSLSWTPIATFELTGRVPEHVSVWREPPRWIEETHGRGFLSYDQVKAPTSIQIRTGSTGGLLQLEWNITGSILLARWENCPQAMHLYSFQSTPEEFRPRLQSVLLHSHPVLSSQWNPFRAGSLAVCCGTGAVYMWGSETSEMCECIGVPAKKFVTRDVRWTGDGQGMVLLDKEMFCCAFEVPEE